MYGKEQEGLGFWFSEEEDNGGERVEICRAAKGQRNGKSSFRG